MKPTRFLAINDLHLTTKPPASRIDDYISEMKDLLEQVERIAVAVGASAVLIAGDVFHLKGRVPYELLLWLWQWGKRVNALAIPGNHDLVDNRYESLPETALGFLFATGGFTNVSIGKPDASPVWISNVLIAGIPFPDAFDLTRWKGPHDLPEAPSYANLPNVGEAMTLHWVVMGHCFASPKGGEHFGEPVLKYSDLCQLPWSAFVFGHDHTDLGVDMSTGKPFINLGALSRGSIAQDDLTREVTCAVLEFPHGPGLPKVVRVKLDAKPVAQLFDLDRKAQLEQEHAQVEAFVETLAMDLPSATGSTLTFEDRVKALNLPDAVYHKVLQYIADAEATV